MAGPFEVAVVAIIAGTAYAAWEKWHKSKQHQMRDEFTEQQKQLTLLTERVAALEKIITDDGYDLKQQFKQL